MKEVKSITMAVRLTPEEKQNLDKICKVRGQTISNYVRELLNQEYKKELIKDGS